jgi:hypothetical protein
MLPMLLECKLRENLACAIRKLILFCLEVATVKQIPPLLPLEKKSTVTCLIPMFRSTIDHIFDHWFHEIVLELKIL